MSVTDCEEPELRERLTQAEYLLEQREREIVEIKHRFSNGLQMAVSLLARQRRSRDSGKDKDALELAIARLTAIGRLHQYFDEHRIVDEVDFGTFLNSLVPFLQASTGLRCLVTADPIGVPGKMALNLAVAVNELVLNAGKHAYSANDGETVKIRCRRRDAQTLEISVSDGGKGLPEDFLPGHSRGLGLSVVQTTAHQYGGELVIENAHGARFTLVIPTG